MKKTAFIFDDVSISPDKQIGLHSSNSWELSYVVAGSGTRTIGDFTEPFIPGEIIIDTSEHHTCMAFRSRGHGCQRTYRQHLSVLRHLDD